jgi:D-sedoheptulose 7-phosphate isomerase
MRTEAADAIVAAAIRTSIDVQGRLLEQEHVNAIVRAAELVTESLQAGGKVLCFGNGGSAADAQHMAAELMGRYLVERSSFPALSLADNSSTVTAVSNDYGFTNVFARQIEGLGRPGDVALGISTSGESENVLEGIAAARKAGLRTIGLTGGGGGRLRETVELCIAVPSESTPRIQEGHALVVHLLCEVVERALAGDA